MILTVMAVSAVSLVLLIGLYVFSKGGAHASQSSNTWVWWRITLQLIVVIFLGWIGTHGHSGS